MIFRLFILLSILFSTSCAVEPQDVELLYADDSQQSWRENDCSSKVQNPSFSWFGLIADENAPAVHSVARMRSVLRAFEKRKTLSYSFLSVSSSTIHFKFIARERERVCHLKHFGGQLLYFLCILRN